MHLLELLVGMLNSVRAPAPTSELAIGDRLADRYVLVELVGRGGTSVAYRADDLATGRSVALKLLDARGDDSRAYLRGTASNANTTRVCVPAQ